MATTAQPYGFQPISHQTGTPRTLRIPNGIATGLASNIFKFAPVKLVSGVLQPLSAITDDIFGIFAGVEYTPSGGRPTESPFWASGTTYDANLDMFAYVWPAFDTTLRVQAQADGTVAQALLGTQFNVTGYTSGNTSTGLSTAALLHAGVGTGVQGQFTLIEFATYVNDAIGDTFTDLVLSVATPQIGYAPITSL